VFLSDTQSPLLVEKLALRSDDNELATQKILDVIAADSSCVALFHLGDITSMGGIAGYWEESDRNSQKIRDAGLPVYPAYGNHEYMPGEEAGIANMIERFPFMTRSWYQTRIDSLAVILLNSNISHLTTGEAAAQERWYIGTLSNLDRDSSVSMVIVGCHHPPYTNSTIVDPSGDVQRLFVPAYMKSRKARLFITGHSHSLEHFQIEGKDFLVVGGGGGLLHPLHQGEEERWHDRVIHSSTRSGFHYMRITPTAGMLAVEIMTLTPDLGRFEAGYRCEIPSLNSDEISRNAGGGR
jgi:predicted phosphodiesterase